MMTLPGLKQRYLAGKKIRQLRKLRHTASEAGYTLEHFDTHRCVFIHIPKCAGVSVSQSLFGNPGAGHYPVRTLRKVLGEDTYNRYFSFTFVRNPWDRLASAYYFLKAGGFNEADRRWAEIHLARYTNFRDFVRNWVTPDSVQSWVHFIPQSDYLVDDDGRIDVDFVGRFESLQADYRKVCVQLGINRPLQTLNRGTAETKAFQSLYDEETRNIVSRVYKNDMTTFGYRFDNS